MTANMKKLLVHIIELNNPKCFNAKIKANRTKLMIEPQGNDIYKVTEYMNRPSMLTGGSYEKENTYNVQVITK